MLRSIWIVVGFFVVNCSFASNWYIGLGAGPEAAEFKQNAYVTFPGSIKVKDMTHLLGSGIFSSIFVGYGWQHQNYYLATELNGNISSVEFKSSNSEFIHKTFSKTSYVMRTGFGLSFLPGILFNNDTVFYGRIGYTKTNFRTSTTDESLASVRKYLNGLRLGLGIRRDLSNQIAARFEYSQVNYQSVRFTTVTGVNKTTRITPKTGQVEFAVIYKFC